MDNRIFTQRNKEILSQLDVLQLGILEDYLNPEERDILLTHSKIVEFSKGETILQQGKQSTDIYLIIAGSVWMTARLLGQGFENIESLGAGSFLNEVSLIEKSPCPSSFIAETAVQCLLITRTYFEMLAIYFPETNYKILTAIVKQVCKRLKKVHDNATSFITHSNMTSLSFIGRAVQSLHQFRQVSFDDVALNRELVQNEFLTAFTAAEREDLIKHSLLLEAAKNCKLVYEGDKKACCYWVIQGAVQSSIMQNNKLAKLSVIGPGTLFASVACIEQDADFTITFITCERALLLKFPQTELNFLQQNKPQLWYKLFNLICGSLVALQKSVDKLDLRLHIETYNR